jgi:Fe-Mn family superoxide dismutase
LLTRHISLSTTYRTCYLLQIRYVATANQILNDEKPSLKELTSEQIIKNVKLAITHPSLFNNIAQSWNHAFYWKCMSVKGGGTPTKESVLMNMIERDFGSFDNLRQLMETAALTAFGSGWAWLGYDGKRKKLIVTKTTGAGNPMTEGITPILTIDVWEHGE